VFPEDVALRAALHKLLELLVFLSCLLEPLLEGLNAVVALNSWFITLVAILTHQRIVCALSLAVVIHVFTQNSKAASLSALLEPSRAALNVLTSVIAGVDLITALVKAFEL